MSAIKMFFHCRQCLEKLPAGITPKDWSRLQAGLTEEGTLKVECGRCGKIICELGADEPIPDLANLHYIPSEGLKPLLEEAERIKKEHERGDKKL